MIMVMAVVAVAGMVMAVVADAYKNAIETEFFASGLKIGWREALLFFRVVAANRPLFVVRAFSLGARKKHHRLTMLCRTVFATDPATLEP